MKSNLKALTLIGILALLLSFSAVTLADAADYPKGTIEIVSTSSAGGDNDFVARTYAEFLGKYWNTPVIVTNIKDRPTALNYVHDAEPDGYTILNTNDAFFVSSINETIDFTVEDMSIIGIHCFQAGSVLVCRAESGWKTIEDVRASAEATPDTYTMAVSYGSGTQVNGQMLLDEGFKVRLVDSDGASDRVAKLLGGHVDLATLSWADVEPYAQSGEWVVLGVMSTDRDSLCPDIPTLMEQGVNAGKNSYFFLSTAPGTDPEILAKWDEAIRAIHEDPEFHAKFIERYGADLSTFVSGDAARTDLLNSFELYQKVLAD